MRYNGLLTIIKLFYKEKDFNTILYDFEDAVQNFPSSHQRKHSALPLPIFNW
jgi:hypothetical protein